MIPMWIRYLKQFSDLKLKNSFTWIFNIWFDLMQKNAELKLKFSSDNWISFLILLFELTYKKIIELNKGQFGTKTQLPKHSLFYIVPWYHLPKLFIKLFFLPLSAFICTNPRAKFTPKATRLFARYINFGFGNILLF